MIIGATFQKRNVWKFEVGIQIPDEKHAFHKGKHTRTQTSPPNPLTSQVFFDFNWSRPCSNNAAFSAVRKLYRVIPQWQRRAEVFLKQNSLSTRRKPVKDELCSHGNATNKWKFVYCWKTIGIQHNVTFDGNCKFCRKYAGTFVPYATQWEQFVSTQ